MTKTSVILTDFAHPRFDYTEDSVMQRVAELHSKTLYGRIGHPPSGCSDLEYFSCPDERERAFKITDIKMDGLTCTGTVEFLDSEEGRKAEQLFENGGRFSIRAISSSHGLVEALYKIVTWDLC